VTIAIASAGACRRLASTSRITNAIIFESVTIIGTSFTQLHLLPAVQNFR
jgi:hypothetical protein